MFEPLHLLNRIQGDTKAIRLAILNVTDANNANTYVAVQEAIINDRANTGSWKTNMTPSASSQYVSNPPQPVTGLIDGNYNLTGNYVSNTGWTNIPANSPDGTERCWFQIDFAQPIQFESLKLVEGLIWSNNFYRRFITNANLYRSSDGIAFELIKEIRDNPTYAQPTLVSYYP